MEIDDGEKFVKHTLIGIRELVDFKKISRYTL